jgi:hypothetical protein|tara:strand:- start:254 stop:487 length:234 start_codon:yes stop_codon:yes gene_type:complete
MTSKYDRNDYTVHSEEDEYLTRVVIDTCARRFYMYSNEGETKVVDADSPQQFMDVLEVVRAICEEDMIAYSDPVIAV